MCCWGWECMRAGPCTCDSRGLHAGGLLLVFASAVSNSILILPGILGAASLSTLIAAIVSRVGWTWGSTGGPRSLGLGSWMSLAGWKPEHPEPAGVWRGGVATQVVATGAGRPAVAQSRLQVL